MNNFEKKLKQYTQLIDSKLNNELFKLQAKRL